MHESASGGPTASRADYSDSLASEPRLPCAGLRHSDALSRVTSLDSASSLIPSPPAGPIGRMMYRMSAVLRPMGELPGGLLDMLALR